MGVKAVEKKVKIFFPLDVDSTEKARELLEEVGDYVDVIKVGLELEKNVGAPVACNIPQKYGKSVFADFKLIDIPATIKGAAKGITGLGVDYFNVMAVGGKAMMEKAVEGAKEKAEELGIPRPKIIAVTVLTSLNYDDLFSLSILPYQAWYTKSLSVCVDFSPSAEKQQDYITDIVLTWAEIAVAAGIDCILPSPKEVEAIRGRWPNIEIICPGIRPPWALPDDQKRTATPYEAVKAGADGLVIGRPIRKPPEGMTREEAVKRIRKDIERALSKM